MAIEVRPFNAETDLNALVELVNVMETAEGREATLTNEQLANTINEPRLHRWVAQIGDDAAALVGYGVVFQQMAQRCYGDARVHPDWRRRGIGRELVDRMVAKSRELGARYLAIDVDAGNQDALRFLLTQEFRFRGHVWALEASPQVVLPRPRWPEGYAVTSYVDAPDLDTYVALCNATFGDLWGHWENFPGAVDAAHLSETLQHFDPAGIFIVRDAQGAAVAQCRAAAAADETSTHILDQPGVIPAAREAGLHVPLALTAAHWLRGIGPQPIRLESWGDSAELIAQYEALGFAQTEHEVSYVMEINKTLEV